MATNLLLSGDWCDLNCMHFLIMDYVLEILSLHISYENLVFLPSVQPKVMFGENHKKRDAACSTCFCCKNSELRCKKAFFFFLNSCLMETLKCYFSDKKYV